MAVALGAVGLPIIVSWASGRIGTVPASVDQPGAGLANGAPIRILVKSFFNGKMDADQIAFTDALARTPRDPLTRIKGLAPSGIETTISLPVGLAKCCP